jgi:TolA-binding protein
MRFSIHSAATTLKQWGIGYTLLFMLQLWSSTQSVGQTAGCSSTEKSDRDYYEHLLAEIKKVEYATQCAKNAATAFADSAFLPELLFQWSEWEVQREKLYFELAMTKYDAQLKLFEEKKLAEEPVEPVLTYQKTLAINHQILDKFPTVPFLNKVLYRTGMCLFEIGQKDSARQIFHTIISQYPDSVYLAEVLFRLGECYFDEGNYQEAANYYQQIMKAWQSPFFAMALYKLAWCHYLTNNFADAISAFYYLLNDIKVMEKIDPELLGKSQAQLKDEIMEYIALGFSDFGGAQTLFNFANETGGSNYTPFLLHKMSNIYLKRDFYDDAVAACKLLIEKFSYYQKLPEAFLVLFSAYEKMGDMNSAFKMHDLIVEYCGPRSKWAQLYKTPEDQKLFDSTLTKIDFQIAAPLINTADSLFATKEYDDAAKKYSQFLKLFAKDKRADHAQYCLAECYYNLNNFRAAADNYQQVVLKFPQSELREDAAYNHIVCYDQLLLQAHISLDDSSLSLKKTELKNLVLACHNFLKWLPNSSKEPEIRLKLAEIFYRTRSLALGEKYARAALVSIIKHNRGQEHRANALNLLSQISFKQGKYKNTEVFANLLIKEHPDSTELVEKSRRMLASSTFKIGEQLKSKGKTELAATKFEEAAIKATDPEIAEASLFEAAAQYEQAGQQQRAAINFENFCKKYPQSKRIKEAIYRAALLREKLEQYQLAARNYLELNRIAADTPEGASALFTAGLAYEKAKDWFSMAETFKRYVATYSSKSENLLEAMFKIAYAYEQKGMIPQANAQYQAMLHRHEELKAAGEFADDYFASQAAFRLAEVKHEQFTKIKLNPPLQVNLKKKQTAFNDLLKAYVAVAKFNIADWSTAAFYRLGLAYEEFSQDILSSPAPPNLKGDDLQTYWASINQQWVVPLQLEALKYYQTNDKLATEHSLNNDWIAKTRARITFLSKKLNADSNVISPTDQVKEAATTVETKAPPTRQKL